MVARIIVETVTTFARHIYRDVEPPGFDPVAARATVVAVLVGGIVVPRPT